MVRCASTPAAIMRLFSTDSMCTSIAVKAKPAAEINIKFSLPSDFTSNVAVAGPTMPPRVPPAATKPNNRFA